MSEHIDSRLSSRLWCMSLTLSVPLLHTSLCVCMFSLLSQPMSGMASPTAQTCLPYSHGRPDLRSYLSGYNSLDSGEQGRRKGPKKALVFACGPSTLVKEAREAAIDAEMEFSTETFEL